MNHAAYIALGANLGRRDSKLNAALAALRSHPKISVEKVSSFLETEPVGGPPGQPKYLNAAAALKTALTPHALLQVLLDTEAKLGRNRSIVERNAPRQIDLDLLLYDDLILDEPSLTLPHPRMAERRFVLEPLSEIAPGVVHPRMKVTVRELLMRLPM